jgi:hypothetical protein
MGDGAWPQNVQLPFKGGNRTPRIEEVVRGVEDATGLTAEWGLDGRSVTFHGEAFSFSDFRASVERALPAGWAEHFHPAIEE